MEPLKQVYINRGALVHNFGVCARQAKGAGVIAVVKADAYGHGMVECARLFVKLGAAGLAVAEAVEGVELRRAGIDRPIHVQVGLAPQTVQDIVAHNLTPLVSDAAMLRLLADEASRQGKAQKVHLKLDVGMGRQGALPDDFFNLVKLAVTLPAIRVSGMMAHLPKGDERGGSNSQMALSAFTRITNLACELVPYACSCHLVNSGGLFYLADAQFDRVRPGIALYGCYPDGAAGREAAAAGAAPKLRPAMSWRAKVILVRQLPSGHTVGYDCTYTTTRPTTVAVLPVGYADGYLRGLSNKAQVLLGGKRAKVLGRVSMNQIVVDVTDIPGVQPGAEATLLGRQGGDEITVDELAGWMGTINYEALCLIGRLNKRVYVD